MERPDKEKKQKFYLDEPYVFLVNPDLLPKKVSIVQGFPIGRILPEFYDLMLKDELDFRILGTALHSAARLHKEKVRITIAHEVKEEKKAEVRRKKHEFTYDKPLRAYMTRDSLQLTSDTDSDIFYEELILSLKEEEVRRKRRFLRRQKDQKGKKKRRRKIELSKLKQMTFAYDVDFENVDVDMLVRDIFNKMLFLRYERKKKEISYTELVNYRIEADEDISEEKSRLERVRVLMSILYLVRDRVIEAYQDLDDFEIYIKVKSKKWKGFKEKDSK
ncbi:MAG: hypothetical protein ACXAEU_03270 [Candidatus Hodarchaeales archaeon]|jgi:hypothetical protein